MLALPPLAAEPIFHFGTFPITNSYINAVLTVIGFIIFAFFINRGVNRYYRNNEAPKGVLNFFEGIIEFLFKYLDQVTGDRQKSIRFLPLVGTLFFFILISNWLGLLPGIGSIWRLGYHGGHLEQLPVFRPATTDLNMTLAMAVLAVVFSHFVGIITIGFFKYANKFIKLGDLWTAIKSLKPMNIVTAVVGIIEIFSEVAKMVSLSLRLFGNVFAGEVLLTVLASLIAFLVPLPFMALELLVGLIQAVVFSMLTLVYLTMATAEVHGHGEGKHEEKHLEPTPTH
jgi:F-type H+-transporting ATPase subunit a